MLDILLFRETPDLVRDSQKKRFKSVELVDKIISLDELWRKTQYQVDQKRKEIGILSKKVGALAKEKAKPEDIEKAKEESRAAKVSLEALEAEVARLKSELDTLIPTVGNIVHPSVPVSNDEANNTIVKTWGDTTKKDGPCEHHHILLAKVDGYDAERGVKVAGHRSYFLKGVGVLLNQALINYGLSFLRKRNYTLLTTPLMMKKAVMSETSQLEDFDEQLYKVGGDYKEEPEKTKGKTAKQIQDEKEEHEKYLIATSEQPISAFHRDENIDPHGLPIKYAGVSTCFRKESGKTGKDVWGIFRVHQFEKVEQFCITAPEVSWDMHEEMLKTSEEFYQSLGLPYRVVNIVSGELNNAAAKKYDLEGWFPGFNGYRELVSCSNCTDYQSRSLRVKNGLKTNEDHTKRFVHMLNSTLCATTRTICCILENYQTAEGVKVPDVLVPYMDGLTFLPFVRNVQYVDHAAH